MVLFVGAIPVKPQQRRPSHKGQHTRIRTWFNKARNTRRGEVQQREKKYKKKYSTSNRSSSRRLRAYVRSQRPSCLPQRIKATIFSTTEERHLPRVFDRLTERRGGGGKQTQYKCFPFFLPSPPQQSSRWPCAWHGQFHPARIHEFAFPGPGKGPWGCVMRGHVTLHIARIWVVGER